MARAFREKCYHDWWYGDHDEECPKKSSPERVTVHHRPGEAYRLEDSCYEKIEGRKPKKRIVT